MVLGAIKKSRFVEVKAIEKQGGGARSKHGTATKAIIDGCPTVFINKLMGH
jgi:hypothetical protein